MNSISTIQRLFAAVVVAIVTLLLVVAPQSPLSELSTPEARAQDVGGWGKTENDYNMCSFRRGTNAAADYANQLCWLDMSGIVENLVASNVGSTHITKDLGRYTLSFDISMLDYNRAQDGTSFDTNWNKDKSRFFNYRDPMGASVYGNNLGGTEYFTQYSTSSISPILGWKGMVTAIDFQQMAKLQFRNISVTDKYTQTKVTNYRLNAMDAQQTGGTGIREFLDFNATSGSQSMNAYSRFTPLPDYRNACDPRRDSRNIFGPGNENFFEEGLRGPVDFICHEYQTQNAKTGSYIVGGDGITSLDVGMGSRGDNQAFALALSMGRMNASIARADTTMEEAATGQATSFDVSMALRNNGKDTKVPVSSDPYTEVIRDLSPSDPSGTTASDQMVFKSTATGAQADRAYARYDPVWTCKVSDSSSSGSYTIKEGSVPSGFELKHTGSTSELIYANPKSRPVQCSVQWVPRFEPAALTLRKTVTGTASNFDEVKTRQFVLGYRCTYPAGFAEAYPTKPQEDQATLAAGQSKTWDGLAAGSNCTLTESFADGAPPALPGKQLTLTWKGNGTTQDNAAVPVGSLTLKPGENVTERTNDVEANNNYDYRPGTATINKTITGEAVNELGSPRDYAFSLTCSTTDYTQRQTLSATGADDTIRGTAEFTNIPVERDCLLKPLSGLSDAESERINFDGREVKVDGVVVPANEDGTYSLRLKDYTQGGTPTAASIDIVAKYSYKKRDVRVVKQLRGPGASKLDEGVVFPVHYKCTDEKDSAYNLEGDTNITTDTADPVKIPDVRVGASCLIYEQGSPEQTNVKLDRTTVSASDASDSTTTLTNDDAKTTPVLTVNSSTDRNQNRVTVSNHYIDKTGTVDLKKLVDNTVNGASLPAGYDLSFQCGTRTIEVSADNYISVDLEGTLTIGEGETQQLVVDTGDSTKDGLVNDKNGALGVPYGNTCTFSEKAPQTGTGVLWSTDVKSASVTVNADSQTATVTNTFEPSGDGVTITQSDSGVEGFFREVNYTLECTAPNGAALDLGEYASITLSADKTKVQVPNTVIAEGSDCQLTEVAGEDGTRDGYEIDRDSTLTMESGTTEFNDEKPIDTGSFTVGKSTVVAIAHDYDYQDRTVDVTKQVNFTNPDYFSKARKDVKYNREFSYQMVCTPPEGGAKITVSGVVISPQSGDRASQKLSFDNIPDGSTCVGTEGETTAAEGIDFTQEVKVGGDTGDRSLEFKVDGDQSVQLVNTYTRRLATVDLTKVANTPIDVQAAYGDNWREQFYTHNFELKCYDPEGPKDGSGALPAFSVAPVEQIQGPGTAAFANVPVGAMCSLTGDKFGQLDLVQDGGKLETHMRPAKVEWRLDRDEGVTRTDSEIPNETTTSADFVIKDNIADGGAGNKVELVNFYEFIKSPIKMSKTISANADDLKLIRAANPTYGFNYRCEGVGYSISNVGLPTELAAGDTNLFPDDGLKYTSDTVTVPSGAMCTFTELNPSTTPKALEWKADPVTVEKRVGAENADPVSYDFTNTYTRRTVPVSFVALQDGYLSGIENDSYAYEVTCKDPGSFPTTLSFDVSTTNSTAMVSDAAAPTGGKVINLPVGYDCTLNLGNSSALQPRVQLETTAGARSPYVAFGSWVGDTPNEKNRKDPINALPGDQVTKDLKTYSYDFNIPEDLRSDSGNPVMTVAGEAMHLRDKVDITFTKESKGAAGEGRTFNFSTTCGESFSLQSGSSHTMSDINVEQPCEISEITAADEPLAYTELGKVGPRIGDAEAVNITDSETRTVISGGWNFTVLPVAEVSDLSTSGPNWALTGVNSFPGINITKKIDGAPISAVTGAVADTAVLPDDATTMRFNYTLENNGVMPLNDIKLTEPELAGRTVVAADGTEYRVPEGGAIPTEVCSPGELAVGASTTCSFDVKITESTDDTFYYRGTVTVTALGNNVLVSDDDSYGAMRLKEGLGFLLPDTGRQTLVWALLIGLILLAIGMALYLRNRNDEETDGEETDGED